MNNQMNNITTNTTTTNIDNKKRYSYTYNCSYLNEKSGKAARHWFVLQ